ncbi:MAG: amidohydrolase, partial [Reyranella sp.]|nr:amidohydrolase [Reyranella sp.]
MRASILALSVVALFGIAPAGADELPIFDAHMHYSHDAWTVVPPKEVVEILKKAGVKRAMVSSSNNEGTKMLQDVAPNVIVPELRPYRSRGELSTWAKDPTLIPFLQDLLSKRKYVAIGEFHIFGADADLPNMRKVVELAKQHGLYLHSHSDAEAVDRTFQQD